MFRRRNSAAWSPPRWSSGKSSPNDVEFNANNRQAPEQKINLRRISTMKLVTTTVMAILLASGAAFAQDYPTKPITLIIPYSPGGSTDLLGRSLANELQKIWDQTVVVENRPG